MDTENQETRGDGSGVVQISRPIEAESEPTQPAFGIVAEDDTGVLKNVARATEQGLTTFIADTPETDSEVARIAQQLGASVIETETIDTAASDARTMLATYAQASSHPGIIIPDDGAVQIDIDRSLEAAGSEQFITSGVSEKATSHPGVLVAIPAYNEAAAIAEVVRDVQQYADEVLVIDDGSSDNTVALAKEAGAVVIEHETNKGYGGALNTAFSEADEREAEHLVIVDGDGQHDASDIPTMVETLSQNDADVSIGSRFAKGSETEIPLYRRFGIEVVNTLTNLSMGVLRPRSWVRDTQSGFRAYNRKAIASLNADSSIGEDMSASTDILHHCHQNSYEIAELGTTISYDVENASSQNPLSHGLGLVNNILTTIERERPVTVLGIPGFVSAFVGLGFGYLTFSKYIANNVFPMGLAITSAFFALAGIFACFTAIILHSMNTHLD
ncbi:glycosyltransferase family 2 protein [Halomarina rubra]|uniref:Glycosyltransferase family 2 protein n=1 Tax=Halomarina rubra TaxID=2071873 RepID=A0ABD6AWV7_9EURY|nr:glycosyltransferase family 2 protein [Halomarina rubra]